MSIDETTAVVLAGGQARRFGGTDKAFLQLDGKYLIEYVLQPLERLFPEIVVVTQDPSRYRNYPVTAITDVVDEGGSLAGIYTGLQVSSHQMNFVAACDMPFLNEDFITYMADEMWNNDYDVVLPRKNSHVEPIHGFYSKRCLEPIRKSLQENRFRIISFFSCVRTRLIPESISRSYDDSLKMFMNINDPADMKRASRILKERTK